jgi:hypothetical protein
VSQGWLVCEYPTTEVTKHLLVRLVVMGSGHVEGGLCLVLIRAEKKKENLEALHYRSSLRRVGVLQIGIRAWLQHLACLGSWMSCVKTTLRGLKGNILPYSLPKKSS